MTTSRRYDIDWLRVIAIGLLLIYHIAIVFQPWGVFIGFITSSESLQNLWIPMSMLNVWRIPLLFFVSGMGVCFAMRKRNWKQLIGERSRRILLPFVAGMLLIAPLHILLFQKYYSMELDYLVNPSHLWFLGNIFIYVVVLSPVLFYLKNHEDTLLKKWLHKLYSNPLGILLIAVPFIAETLIVKPDIYELYAMTAHGFWLGLLAFFFGFTFIYSGEPFWKTVLKWKWAFAGLGLVLFLIRYFVFQLKSPDFIMPVETISWIMAVLGLGHHYLNKPGKTLTYLSEAAYPIYIIHMSYLYLGAYLVLPLEIATIWKFVLVVAFTGIACFATYELIIKRVFFLRPLFGLKIIPMNNLRLKLKPVVKATLIILGFAIIQTGCSRDFSDNYPYTPPADLQDGIRVGTLQDAHIDSSMLLKAVGRLHRGKYEEVHSMLIYKQGMLAFEDYYPGHEFEFQGSNYHGNRVVWDVYTNHHMMSVTKSFNSTCLGLAIENGFIRSVDQSIFDYLPDHQHLRSGGKEDIKIEHLVSMTSGLDWTEWGKSYTIENDIINIWFQEDPIAFVLTKPLKNQPGKKFNYSGGNMIVLSKIIENASDMEFDAFTRKYLFDPLDIIGDNWDRYKHGAVDAAGGLQITPRDMIKLGVTFLENGAWNEQQIISSDWVENAQINYGNNTNIDVPGERARRSGYGYGWWTKKLNYKGQKTDYYYAGGWGGQNIIVIPSLETVIVFTGGNYTSDNPVFEILERFIVPAIA